VKPYSEAQWRAIDELGRRVDADLAALDVRLTQGGEPTFVAAAGGDAPEWNYTASSPGKRQLAARLLRRLHARFAPQGLMLFSQGKWYPGEALPRWAFGLYWRKDGAPLWRDARWIAGEGSNPDHRTEDARRLIGALASKLMVQQDFVMPVYEDPWVALDAESRIPVGVDPLSGNLADGAERAQLARLLRQGLGSVAGYALPLRSESPAAGPRRAAEWRSGRWPQRRERLYLAPGDSRIGYRLPLDTLPEGDEIVRTALCVEARGGVVHVFLPPLDSLEAYLELVAVIERCATELELPVIPEGYEPPPDPSLRVLKVTPDPGVIEVNVQPAADWAELNAITAAVYEEARALSLVAEKFMRDGRRAGTGGGNHITLGGAIPGESPVLRRPALLASLITCWQNHPALSYFFAGQYIGPTCQAPRADEAREDSLRELEIAFREIERLTGTGVLAPEQLDRLLRDLLVDVTGNTHRAEFCIDKLWSPDGPTGRLGLLELRAFEMAPHERMAAVQYLLVRALVAQFWKRPYGGRLAPWGTALHDRFMLPHYIAEDMREVVSILNAAGCAFEFDWLGPFFDFRFPRCGSVVHGGITLELRQALEPWPVLGEAAATGGTSRDVDASLERVQVKVSGIDDQRHVVLCNGRRLPLHPAGAPGEHVAGVRFRARLSPRMLHSTIGLHTPLVFDIVDARSGRSIGGCAYHAANPAGTSYDRLPADAAEAESRCRERFETRRAGASAVKVSTVPAEPGTPYTLDLRRPAE
jgi:uncharacterized protein (DUF2126 family)